MRMTAQAILAASTIIIKSVSSRLLFWERKSPGFGKFFLVSRKPQQPNIFAAGTILSSGMEWAEA